MKKRKILLGIVVCSAVLLSVVSVNAQSVIEVEWKKSFGSVLRDNCQCVTSTSDGGYVTTGFSTSTDIDGFTPKGNEDGTVIKYDSNGEIEWKHNYGGNKGEYFEGILQTSDGGYIIAGYTSSTDIEGITAKGGNDALILKIDARGNTEWIHSYGGSNIDTYLEAVETSDGGYIAVGYTNSTEIEGVSSLGDSDVIMVKYSSSGEMVWKKYYGGTGYDCFYSVTPAENGGFVAAGITNSTDIPGLTSLGLDDGLIVKFDANGDAVWEKSYGGANADYYYSVDSTSDGGYVAVGYTYSSITGFSRKGMNDALIVKYDTNGDVEWQNIYGGYKSDSYNCVVETTDGGYVAVGYTESPNIPGMTAKGGYDGIIVKYNANGEMEWQDILAGTSYEEYSSVTTLKDDSIVAVGYFLSTDIDGLENKGSFDSMAVKYSIKSDITKIDSTNGSYTIDKISAISGSTVTITPAPDKGYEVDAINVVNSLNNRITVTNNTFIMPSSDVTVSVTFKKINCKIVEGKDSTYSNTDLSLKLENDVSLIDKILVNDKELIITNYTVKESTKTISINNDYLSSLGVGTYTLKVTYTNGTSDTTTFKVEEKKSEATEKEKEELKEGVKEEVKEDNPKTLDNVLFYVELGSLSIIGLVGSGLYLKKKRFN